MYEKIWLDRIYHNNTDTTWDSRYSFFSGNSNGIWNSKTSFEGIEQQIISEGIKLSNCKPKDVTSQDLDAVGAIVAEQMGKNPNGDFLECDINNKVIRIYKCIESSIESNIADKVNRFLGYNCNTIDFINQSGTDDEFVKSKSGDFTLFIKKI
ncbi:hypothetical protein ACERCG_00970 [Mannheimia sp. E30BD]|uniref:hypothetical protein n=1 Tax=Mannheimia sp. E30BD TaxID=3278708 RepID=UPI00359D78AA